MFAEPKTISQNCVTKEIMATIIVFVVTCIISSVAGQGKLTTIED